MPTITVRLDRVYSNMTCYPVCALALGFANIAGTKTLTPGALRTIRHMGFNVVVQGYPVDAIDAFLSGRLR